MKSAMTKGRLQAARAWQVCVRTPFRSGMLVAALLLLGGGAALQSIPARTLPSRPAASHTGTIPAAEFARITQEFSEEGGYFFSDNFTSNESAYLYAVDELKRQGGTGGAYIGVGPEQNFTYIAKVRPEIAFIVDIRRQAVIQHLMYKAIFHLAEDRAQFLSLLLSKPLAGADAPRRGTPIEKVLEYFESAPPSEEAFRSNLARIEKTIRRDFHLAMTGQDRSDLTYVYQVFSRASLRVAFRVAGDNFGGFWGARFPNLRDLILATDQSGKLGNFLALEDDYDFVRRLHRQNRIIPVVGDFGGRKALAAVARYLRENGYTLTAFYTSNVEQFLFDGRAFDSFVENVRQMPLTHKSVILRAVRAGGRYHPAYIPGHRMTPLLQFIPVFLKDYDSGAYRSYWDLVTTHYIAAREP
ncbi:MAG TPA: hypothetical protein VIC04_07600 [Terriglobia bacterium]|jgi:hypothetical protein